MKFISKYCLVLASAALLLASISLTAQTPTQTLISVESKTGAAPAMADIAIKVGGKATPLTGWDPMLSGKGTVQIAILIDSSLHQSMAQQAADIQNFITHLPPNVLVFVGYIESSHVTTVHDFSNNHTEVAAAVKPPAGGGHAAGDNPYQAMGDMAKRWPITPAARIALLLTNGVDPGVSGGGAPSADGTDMASGGGESANIHPAADAAAKSGIAVYSIFYNESASLGSDALAGGASALNQLAEATGGISYAEGTRSPVLLGPVMDRFNKALQSTFVASFSTPANKKTVSLKATAKDAKLHAADNVLPGNLEAPPAQ